MDHRLDKIHQIAVEFLWQGRHLAASELVPVLPVLGEGASSGALQGGQSESENVSLGEVRVVFVEYFVGKVPTVTFFYLELVKNYKVKKIMQ